MKEGLLPFHLPIYGLHLGAHDYVFNCDKAFFEMFEYSILHEASIEVLLHLEKKSDMIVMDFIFKGNFDASCDRCTANISLPISGEERLILKYAEINKEDEDIVFISKDTDFYNIAQHIYEFIHLHRPITNRIDCEKMKIKPCDQSVLDKIRNNNETITNDDSIWDSLKNLDIK